jgi:hypothetical protein
MGWRAHGTFLMHIVEGFVPKHFHDHKLFRGLVVQRFEDNRTFNKIAARPAGVFTLRLDFK